jgi:hypothetical protein
MHLDQLLLTSCQDLEADATLKLGRPPNDEELKGIRNACGGQMLELVSGAIYADFEPEKLSKHFIDAGIAFEARLTEFRVIAEKHARTLLGRALSAEEISHLAKNEYWTDYLNMFIQISKMPENNRVIPEPPI